MSELVIRSATKHWTEFLGHANVIAHEVSFKQWQRERQSNLKRKFNKKRISFGSHEIMDGYKHKSASKDEPISVFPGSLICTTSMSFKILIDIRIRAFEEDYASCRFFSRYQYNSFAFRSMGKFLDIPEIMENEDYYVHGTLENFFHFLDRIEFALTKLSVHPQRDQFFHYWKMMFGSETTAKAEDFIYMARLDADLLGPMG